MPLEISGADAYAPPYVLIASGGETVTDQSGENQLAHVPPLQNAQPFLSIVLLWTVKGIKDRLTNRRLQRGLLLQPSLCAPAVEARPVLLEAHGHVQGPIGVGLRDEQVDDAAREEAVVGSAGVVGQGHDDVVVEVPAEEGGEDEDEEAEDEAGHDQDEEEREEADVDLRAVADGEGEREVECEVEVAADEGAELFADAEWKRGGVHGDGVWRETELP